MSKPYYSFKNEVKGTLEDNTFFKLLDLLESWIFQNDWTTIIFIIFLGIIFEIILIKIFEFFTEKTVPPEIDSSISWESEDSSCLKSKKLGNWSIIPPSSEEGVDVFSERVTSSLTSEENEGNFENKILSEKEIIWAGADESENQVSHFCESHMPSSIGTNSPLSLFHSKVREIFLSDREHPENEYEAVQFSSKKLFSIMKTNKNKNIRFSSDHSFSKTYKYTVENEDLNMAPCPPALLFLSRNQIKLLEENVRNRIPLRHKTLEVITTYLHSLPQESLIQNQHSVEMVISAQAQASFPEQNAMQNQGFYEIQFTSQAQQFIPNQESINNQPDIKASYFAQAQDLMTKPFSSSTQDSFQAKDTDWSQHLIEAPCFIEAQDSIKGLEFDEYLYEAQYSVWFEDSNNIKSPIKEQESVFKNAEFLVLTLNPKSIAEDMSQLKMGKPEGQQRIALSGLNQCSMCSLVLLPPTAKGQKNRRKAPNSKSKFSLKVPSLKAKKKPSYLSKSIIYHTSKNRNEIECESNTVKKKLHQRKDISDTTLYPISVFRLCTHHIKKYFRTKLVTDMPHLLKCRYFLQKQNKSLDTEKINYAGSIKRENSGIIENVKLYDRENTGLKSITPKMLSQLEPYFIVNPDEVKASYSLLEANQKSTESPKDLKQTLDPQIPKHDMPLEKMTSEPVQKLISSPKMKSNRGVKVQEDLTSKEKSHLPLSNGEEFAASTPNMQRCFPEENTQQQKDFLKIVLELSDVNLLISLGTKKHISSEDSEGIKSPLSTESVNLKQKKPLRLNISEYGNLSESEELECNTVSFIKNMRQDERISDAFDNATHATIPEPPNVEMHGRLKAKTDKSTVVITGSHSASKQEKLPGAKRAQKTKYIDQSSVFQKPQYDSERKEEEEQEAVPPLTPDFRFSIHLKQKPQYVKFEMEEICSGSRKAQNKEQEIPSQLLSEQTVLGPSSCPMMDPFQIEKLKQNTDRPSGKENDMDHMNLIIPENVPIGEYLIETVECGVTFGGNPRKTLDGHITEEEEDLKRDLPAVAMRSFQIRKILSETKSVFNAKHAIMKVKKPAISLMLCTKRRDAPSHRKKLGGGFEVIIKKMLQDKILADVLLDVYPHMSVLPNGRMYSRLNEEKISHISLVQDKSYINKEDESQNTLEANLQDEVNEAREALPKAVPRVHPGEERKADKEMHHPVPFTKTMKESVAFLRMASPHTKNVKRSLATQTDFQCTAGLEMSTPIGKSLMGVPFNQTKENNVPSIGSDIREMGYHFAEEKAELPKNLQETSPEPFNGCMPVLSPSKQKKNRVKFANMTNTMKLKYIKMKIMKPPVSQISSITCHRDKSNFKTQVKKMNRVKELEPKCLNTLYSPVCNMLLGKFSHAHVKQGEPASKKYVDVFAKSDLVSEGEDNFQEEEEQKATPQNSEHLRSDTCQIKKTHLEESDLPLICLTQELPILGQGVQHKTIFPQTTLEASFKMDTTETELWKTSHSQNDLEVPMGPNIPPPQAGNSSHSELKNTVIKCDLSTGGNPKKELDSYFMQKNSEVPMDVQVTLLQSSDSIIVPFVSKYKRQKKTLRLAWRKTPESHRLRTVREIKPLILRMLNGKELWSNIKMKMKDPQQRENAAEEFWDIIHSKVTILPNIKMRRSLNVVRINAQTITSSGHTQSMQEKSSKGRKVYCLDSTYVDSFSNRLKCGKEREGEPEALQTPENGHGIIFSAHQKRDHGLVEFGEKPHQPGSTNMQVQPEAHPTLTLWRSASCPALDQFQSEKLESCARFSPPRTRDAKVVSTRKDFGVPSDVNYHKEQADGNENKGTLALHFCTPALSTSERKRNFKQFSENKTLVKPKYGTRKAKKLPTSHMLNIKGGANPNCRKKSVWNLNKMKEMYQNKKVADKMYSSVTITSDINMYNKIETKKGTRKKRLSSTKVKQGNVTSDDIKETKLQDQEKQKSKQEALLKVIPQYSQHFIFSSDQRKDHDHYKSKNQGSRKILIVTEQDVTQQIQRADPGQGQKPKKDLQIQNGTICTTSLKIPFLKSEESSTGEVLIGTEKFGIPSDGKYMGEPHSRGEEEKAGFKCDLKATVLESSSVSTTNLPESERQRKTFTSRALKRKMSPTWMIMKARKTSILKIFNIPQSGCQKNLFPKALITQIVENLPCCSIIPAGFHVVIPEDPIAEKKKRSAQELPAGILECLDSSTLVLPASKGERVKLMKKRHKMSPKCITLKAKKTLLSQTFNIIGCHTPSHRRQFNSETTMKQGKPVADTSLNAICSLMSVLPDTKVCDTMEKTDRLGKIRYSSRLQQQEQSAHEEGDWCAHSGDGVLSPDGTKGAKIQGGGTAVLVSQHFSFSTHGIKTTNLVKSGLELKTPASNKIPDIISTPPKLQQQTVAAQCGLNSVSDSFPFEKLPKRTKSQKDLKEIRSGNISSPMVEKPVSEFLIDRTDSHVPFERGPGKEFASLTPEGKACLQEDLQDRTLEPLDFSMPTSSEFKGQRNAVQTAKSVTEKTQMPLIFERSNITRYCALSHRKKRKFILKNMTKETCQDISNKFTNTFFPTLVSPGIKMHKKGESARSPLRKTCNVTQLKQYELKRLYTYPSNKRTMSSNTIEARCQNEEERKGKEMLFDAGPRFLKSAEKRKGQNLLIPEQDVQQQTMVSENTLESICSPLVTSFQIKNLQDFPPQKNILHKIGEKFPCPKSEKVISDDPLIDEIEYNTTSDGTPIMMLDAHSVVSPLCEAREENKNAQKVKKCTIDQNILATNSGNLVFDNSYDKNSLKKLGSHIAKKDDEEQRDLLTMGMLSLSDTKKQRNVLKFPESQSLMSPKRVTMKAKKAVCSQMLNITKHGSLYHRGKEECNVKYTLKDNRQNKSRVHTFLFPLPVLTGTKVGSEVHRSSKAEMDEPRIKIYHHILPELEKLPHEDTQKVNFTGVQNGLNDAVKMNVQHTEVQENIQDMLSGSVPHYSQHLSFGAYQMEALGSHKSESDPKRSEDRRTQNLSRTAQETCLQETILEPVSEHMMNFQVQTMKISPHMQKAVKIMVGLKSSSPSAEELEIISTVSDMPWDGNPRRKWDRPVLGEKTWNHKNFLRTSSKPLDLSNLISSESKSESYTLDFVRKSRMCPKHLTLKAKKTPISKLLNISRYRMGGQRKKKQHNMKHKMRGVQWCTSVTEVLLEASKGTTSPPSKSMIDKLLLDTVRGILSNRTFQRTLVGHVTEGKAEVEENITKTLLGPSDFFMPGFLEPKIQASMVKSSENETILNPRCVTTKEDKPPVSQIPKTSRYFETKHSKKFKSNLRTRMKTMWQGNSMTGSFSDAICFTPNTSDIKKQNKLKMEAVSRFSHTQLTQQLPAGGISLYSNSTDKSSSSSFLREAKLHDGECGKEKREPPVKNSSFYIKSLIVNEHPIKVPDPGKSEVILLGQSFFPKKQIYEEDPGKNVKVENTKNVQASYGVGPSKMEKPPVFAELDKTKSVAVFSRKGLDQKGIDQSVLKEKAPYHLTGNMDSVGRHVTVSEEIERQIDNLNIVSTSVPKGIFSKVKRSAVSQPLNDAGHSAVGIPKKKKNFEAQKRKVERQKAILNTEMKSIHASMPKLCCMKMEQSPSTWDTSEKPSEKGKSPNKAEVREKEEYGQQILSRTAPQDIQPFEFGADQMREPDSLSSETPLIDTVCPEKIIPQKTEIYLIDQEAKVKPVELFSPESVSFSNINPPQIENQKKEFQTANGETLTNPKTFFLQKKQKPQEKSGEKEEYRQQVLSRTAPQDIQPFEFGADQLKEPDPLNSEAPLINTVCPEKIIPQKTIYLIDQEAKMKPVELFRPESVSFSNINPQIENQKKEFQTTDGETLTNPETFALQERQQEPCISGVTRSSPYAYAPMYPEIVRHKSKVEIADVENTRHTKQVKLNTKRTRVSWLLGCSSRNNKKELGGNILQEKAFCLSKTATNPVQKANFDSRFPVSCLKKPTEIKMQKDELEKINIFSEPMPEKPLNDRQISLSECVDMSGIIGKPEENVREEQTHQRILVDMPQQSLQQLQIRSQQMKEQPPVKLDYSQKKVCPEPILQKDETDYIGLDHDKLKVDLGKEIHHVIFSQKREISGNRLSTPRIRKDRELDLLIAQGVRQRVADVAKHSISVPLGRERSKKMDISLSSKGQNIFTYKKPELLKQESIFPRDINSVSCPIREPPHLENTGQVAKEDMYINTKNIYPLLGRKELKETDSLIRCKGQNFLYSKLKDPLKIHAAQRRHVKPSHTPESILGSASYPSKEPVPLKQAVNTRKENDRLSHSFSVNRWGKEQTELTDSLLKLNRQKVEFSKKLRARQLNTCNQNKEKILESILTCTLHHLHIENAKKQTSAKAILPSKVSNSVVEKASNEVSILEDQPPCTEGINMPITGTEEHLQDSICKVFPTSITHPLMDAYQFTLLQIKRALKAINNPCFYTSITERKLQKKKCMYKALPQSASENGIPMLDTVNTIHCDSSTSQMRKTLKQMDLTDGYTQRRKKGSKPQHLSIFYKDLEECMFYPQKYPCLWPHSVPPTKQGLAEMDSVLSRLEELNLFSTDQSGTVYEYGLEHSVPPGTPRHMRKQDIMSVQPCSKAKEHMTCLFSKEKQSSRGAQVMESTSNGRSSKLRVGTKVQSHKVNPEEGYIPRILLHSLSVCMSVLHESERQKDSLKQDIMKDIICPQRKALEMKNISSDTDSDNPSNRVEGQQNVKEKTVSTRPRKGNLSSDVRKTDQPTLSLPHFKLDKEKIAGVISNVKRRKQHISQEEDRVKAVEMEEIMNPYFTLKAEKSLSHILNRKDSPLLKIIKPESKVPEDKGKLDVKLRLSCASLPSLSHPNLNSRIKVRKDKSGILKSCLPPLKPQPSLNIRGTSYSESTSRHHLNNIMESKCLLQKKRGGRKNIVDVKDIIGLICIILKGKNSPFKRFMHKKELQWYKKEQKKNMQEGEKNQDVVQNEFWDSIPPPHPEWDPTIKDVYMQGIVRFCLPLLTLQELSDGIGIYKEPIDDILSSIKRAKYMQNIYPTSDSVKDAIMLTMQKEEESVNMEKVILLKERKSLAVSQQIQLGIKEQEKKLQKIKGESNVILTSTNTCIPSPSHLKLDTRIGKTDCITEVRRYFLPELSYQKSSGTVRKPSKESTEGNITSGTQKVKEYMPQREEGEVKILAEKDIIYPKAKDLEGNGALSQDLLLNPKKQRKTDPGGKVNCFVAAGKAQDKWDREGEGQGEVNQTSRKQGKIDQESESEQEIVLQVCMPSEPSLTNHKAGKEDTQEITRTAISPLQDRELFDRREMIHTKSIGEEKSHDVKPVQKHKTQKEMKRRNTVNMKHRIHAEDVTFKANQLQLPHEPTITGHGSPKTREQANINEKLGCVQERKHELHEVLPLPHCKSKKGVEVMEQKQEVARSFLPPSHHMESSDVGKLNSIVSPLKDISSDSKRTECLIHREKDKENVLKKSIMYPKHKAVKIKESLLDNMLKTKKLQVNITQQKKQRQEGNEDTDGLLKTTYSFITSLPLFELDTIKEDDEPGKIKSYIPHPVLQESLPPCQTTLRESIARCTKKKSYAKQTRQCLSQKEGRVQPSTTRSLIQPSGSAFKAKTSGHPHVFSVCERSALHNRQEPQWGTGEKAGQKQENTRHPDVVLTEICPVPSPSHHLSPSQIKLPKLSVAGRRGRTDSHEGVGSHKTTSGAKEHVPCGEVRDRVKIRGTEGSILPNRVSLRTEASPHPHLYNTKKLPLNIKKERKEEQEGKREPGVVLRKRSLPSPSYPEWDARINRQERTLGRTQFSFPPLKIQDASDSDEKACTESLDSYMLSDIKEPVQSIAQQEEKDRFKIDIKDIKIPKYMDLKVQKSSLSYSLSTKELPWKIKEQKEKMQEYKSKPLMDLSNRITKSSLSLPQFKESSRGRLACPETINGKLSNEVQELEEHMLQKENITVDPKDTCLKTKKSRILHTQLGDLQWKSGKQEEKVLEGKSEVGMMLTETSAKSPPLLPDVNTRIEEESIPVSARSSFSIVNFQESLHSEGGIYIKPVTGDILICLPKGKQHVQQNEEEDGVQIIKVVFPKHQERKVQECPEEPSASLPSPPHHKLDTKTEPDDELLRLPRSALPKISSIEKTVPTGSVGGDIIKDVKYEKQHMSQKEETDRGKIVGRQNTDISLKAKKSPSSYKLHRTELHMTMSGHKGKEHEGPGEPHRIVTRKIYAFNPSPPNLKLDKDTQVDEEKLGNRTSVLPLMCSTLSDAEKIAGTEAISGDVRKRKQISWKEERYELKTVDMRIGVHCKEARLPPIPHILNLKEFVLNMKVLEKKVHEGKDESCVVLTRTFLSIPSAPLLYLDSGNKVGENSAGMSGSSCSQQNVQELLDAQKRAIRGSVEGDSKNAIKQAEQHVPQKKAEQQRASDFMVSAQQRNDLPPAKSERDLISKDKNIYFKRFGTTQNRKGVELHFTGQKTQSERFREPFGVFYSYRTMDAIKTGNLKRETEITYNLNKKISPGVSTSLRGEAAKEICIKFNTPVGSEGVSVPERDAHQEISSEVSLGYVNSCKFDLPEKDVQSNNKISKMFSPKVLAPQKKQSLEKVNCTKPSTSRNIEQVVIMENQAVPLSESKQENSPNSVLSLKSPIQNGKHKTLLEIDVDKKTTADSSLQILPAIHMDITEFNTITGKESQALLVSEQEECVLELHSESLNPLCTFQLQSGLLVEEDETNTTTTVHLERKLEMAGNITVNQEEEKLEIHTQRPKHLEENKMEMHKNNSGSLEKEDTGSVSSSPTSLHYLPPRTEESHSKTRVITRKENFCPIKHKEELQLSRVKQNIQVQKPLQQNILDSLYAYIPLSFKDQKGKLTRAELERKLSTRHLTMKVSNHSISQILGSLGHSTPSNRMKLQYEFNKPGSKFSWDKPAPEIFIKSICASMMRPPQSEETVKFRTNQDREKRVCLSKFRGQSPNAGEIVKRDTSTVVKRERNFKGPVPQKSQPFPLHERQMQKHCHVKSEASLRRKTSGKTEVGKKTSKKTPQTERRIIPGHDILRVIRRPDSRSTEQEEKIPECIPTPTKHSSVFKAPEETVETHMRRTVSVTDPALVEEEPQHEAPLEAREYSLLPKQRDQGELAWDTTSQEVQQQVAVPGTVPTPLQVRSDATKTPSGATSAESLFFIYEAIKAALDYQVKSMIQDKVSYEKLEKLQTWKPDDLTSPTPLPESPDTSSAVICSDLQHKPLLRYYNPEDKNKLSNHLGSKALEIKLSLMPELAKKSLQMFDFCPTEAISEDNSWRFYPGHEKLSFMSQERVDSIELNLKDNYQEDSPPLSCMKTLLVNVSSSDSKDFISKFNNLENEMSSVILTGEMPLPHILQKYSVKGKDKLVMHFSMKILEIQMKALPRVVRESCAVATAQDRTKPLSNCIHSVKVPKRKNRIFLLFEEKSLHQIDLDLQYKYLRFLLGLSDDSMFPKPNALPKHILKLNPISVCNKVDDGRESHSLSFDTELLEQHISFKKENPYKNSLFFRKFLEPTYTCTFDLSLPCREQEDTRAVSELRSDMTPEKDEQYSMWSQDTKTYKPFDLRMKENVAGLVNSQSTQTSEDCIDTQISTESPANLDRFSFPETCESQEYMFLETNSYLSQESQNILLELQKGIPLKNFSRMKEVTTYLQQFCKEDSGSHHVRACRRHTLLMKPPSYEKPRNRKYRSSSKMQPPDWWCHQSVSTVDIQSLTPSISLREEQLSWTSGSRTGYSVASLTESNMEVHLANDQCKPHMYLENKERRKAKFDLLRKNSVHGDSNYIHTHSKEIHTRKRKVCDCDSGGSNYSPSKHRSSSKTHHMGVDFHSDRKQDQPFFYACVPADSLEIIPKTIRWTIPQKTLRKGNFRIPLVVNTSSPWNIWSSSKKLLGSLSGSLSTVHQS